MASRLRRLDGAWLRKLCRWLGIRKLTADNDDCPQGAVYAVETMSECMQVAAEGSVRASKTVRRKAERGSHRIEVRKMY